MYSILSFESFDEKIRHILIHDRISHIFRTIQIVTHGVIFLQNGAHFGGNFFMTSMKSGLMATQHLRVFHLHQGLVKT